MKVNNPNQKEGVFKLGEHNGSPIYYSSTQKDDELLVGRKDKTTFYITGSLQKQKYINLIECYESK